MSFLIIYGSKTEFADDFIVATEDSAVHTGEFLTRGQVTELDKLLLVGGSKEN